MIKTKKLSPNWIGPYPIVKLFDSVVELKLPRRFIRVNVSRIKPFVPQVAIEKRLTDLPHVNIFTDKKKKNEPNFISQREEQAPVPLPPIINPNTPRHVMPPPSPPHTPLW